MDGSIRSYRDLVAWQKAFDLGIALYRFSSKLPDHERFGLVTTIRRTALLLPRQIAEGYGKQNTQAYLTCLRNARATTYDLETQVLFAVELKYMMEEEGRALVEQVAESGRVISGLIRSVESSVR